ncbi:fatty acid desaturase [Nostoc sp. T09]|uniref:fatty acid desaturase family protein n=1 Tax=Nostoc sp. T09 TaxID=1932621 RepID=UPI000A3D449B|nr:fatty acid desaturase family protein [Nostoc sp. T09]OUL34367.1 fatty acid desaturase [Nostoc sp. T09]
MNTNFTQRDYSLVGPESQKASESGLSCVQWYRTPVPRQQLKELMKRSDMPALRDTVLWFTLIITTGAIAYISWGTWLAIPAFLVYGWLYGGASDSRWHECSHGTAFKTKWLNDLVYQIASFMVLRESTLWRWSHSRHHTDTLIVGRDPEIASPRPPSFINLGLNLLNLKTGLKQLRQILLHSLGLLSAEEKSYVPEREHSNVILTARIYMAISISVIAWSIAIASWMPLMFIGLPSFYGASLHVFFGLTQHAGLAEDVQDHRLNSRTIYMNPVFRFLYWNMNYHVEHHMFPMVPYHALSALHEAIKHDVPPPYSSCWEAYKEIIPALIKQRQDPTYFVVRKLPVTETTKTKAIATP